ncbi:MAG: TetR/AcrR family transcriptional regulator [Muribaculaceae bacterium]|nr:TetR/AcrR family transcriptional regulator [Muribaculaceae bacterium]
MSEEKKRRPRRTKANLIECINNATEELIRKDGFSKILVTDIIKRAKIEPVVFYNRYNNLETFLSEFVKNYDYWFSDVLKNLKHPIMSKEGMTEIFQQLLLELNKDSIMLELLRWEVANGNSTTTRTAMLREIHIMPLVKDFEERFHDKDIAALTALIIGGLYYLSLHKDRSSFSGIDINTENGMSRIQKAVEYFTDKIYEDNKLEEERKLMAVRLKEEGVSDEVILKCIWGK